MYRGLKTKGGLGSTAHPPIKKKSRDLTATAHIWLRHELDHYLNDSNYKHADSGNVCTNGDSIIKRHL